MSERSLAAHAGHGRTDARGEPACVTTNALMVLVYGCCSCCARAPCRDHKLAGWKAAHRPGKVRGWAAWTALCTVAVDRHQQPSHFALSRCGAFAWLQDIVVPVLVSAGHYKHFGMDRTPLHPMFPQGKPKRNKVTPSSVLVSLVPHVCLDGRRLSLRELRIPRAGAVLCRAHLRQPAAARQQQALAAQLRAWK